MYRIVGVLICNLLGLTRLAYFIAAGTDHFRRSQKMSDRIRLIKIIVVIGKKIFRFGLLTMMSPGNRPRGSLLITGQSKPRMTMITPMIIRVFCIVR